MLTYRLTHANPLTGYVPVEIQIPAAGAGAVTLQLAAWRPGRYELQNFAQKVRGLTVTDAAGQPVSWRKVTKDRWEIEAGAKALVVRYEFYARQLDAGGSWLDEGQLYVNPINCLPSVMGRKDEPCQLELVVPDDWRVACALPAAGTDPRVLQAATYDELVDSPLIASPTLRLWEYEVGGAAFSVWVQGNGAVDARLLTHFQAFTEVQLALFGGFPRAAYHFLVQLLPTRFYHGVEHTTSTVLALGPGEQLSTWALYKELLGVASHELFHVWNVKLIRPAELQPYDYTREQYFRTGYVAEGLTTYYGDLLLARAGVFSPEQYITELNGVLAKHFADEGPQHLSVADSSMDLWLDGYKAGAPHRKASIYHKGALAALLLDLTLRALTGGERTLDDVMRALWAEFGQTGRGYTEADYRRVVEAVAGRPLAWYFRDVIDGTVPLDSLLDRALGTVGARLRIEPNPGAAEGRFGFRVNTQNALPDVVGLAHGSPAERALSLDDEIVAVNGRKIENNLAALLHDAVEVELTLFRQKTLRTVQLTADGGAYFRRYTVEIKPDGAEAFARFLQK